MYFRSYEIFSGGKSGTKIGLELKEHKFSALYLLYFQSYQIFSGGKSGTKIGLELKELKFFVNKFGNLSVSEPSSVSTLSVLSYGLWP